MITNQNNKGFTLIELLVVVAIIGILASVVLASLSTARTRGKDAAIKAAVSSAITQAEIVANGTTYAAATICATGTSAVGTDTALANMATNVSSNNGNSGLKCSASANGVAFYANLASTGIWCVDNTGYANTVATAPAGTLGKCQ